MQPNTRSCLLTTLLVVNVALAQVERMPLNVLIREPTNLLPLQPQMEPTTTTTTTTTAAPTTTSTTTVAPTRILQPIQQHPTIQQIFVAPPSTTTSTTTTTELPISSSSTTSSTTTTTTTTTTVPPTRILQPIQQHPTIQQIFVAPPSTTTSTTTTTELPSSSSSSTTSSTTTSTTAAVSSSASPSSINPSTTSTSSTSPSTTSTSITGEWISNDSPIVSSVSTSTPSAPSSTSSAPPPPPPPPTTTTTLVEKNILKQDDFNEILTPCLKSPPPVDINETEPRESLPWTEQFQSHLNAPLQRYSLHLLIALSIMTTLFTVTLYLYLRKPKSFMPSTQGGAYDNPRFAKFSTYYVDHSHVRLVDENNQNFHNDAIIEQLNQSSKHKNQEADKTSPLQQQHSHYQMDAVYHQNNRLI